MEQHAEFATETGRLIVVKDGKPVDKVTGQSVMNISLQRLVPLNEAAQRMVADQDPDDEE